MEKAKPFAISKQAVWESYKRVKANRGAAGIDEVTLREFEQDLKNNLYKLWNRMASGSYHPPAVKAVPIPKKSGGTRLLGVPTVADRIAQMVVKRALEPLVEPHFHKDSYGYRPGKSAHDALAETRKRCWRYDWVLEFDIRGLFDNIDHELLMRAVRKHTECRWVILYIERWLTAPFQKEGELVKRTKGTPQGGVVSPLLANLFLHYVFDLWMSRNAPNLPWARYADDGLVHCRSEAEAKNILQRLKERFAECGLELHPDKTRIVYCKDDDRRKDCPITSFDFLGYTFRPRLAKNKRGKFFVSFLPAISNAAAKKLREQIHDWRVHLKPDKSIEDLSRMFNPIVRGWINYYGRFYKSWLNVKVLRYLNGALVHWVRRKYKRFSRHRRNAEHWLCRLARRSPRLFAHWQMGVLPSAG